VAGRLTGLSFLLLLCACVTTEARTLENPQQKVAGPAKVDPRPLGYAGRPRSETRKDAAESYLDAWEYERADFEPTPDRWRIGLPRWDRTPVPSEDLVSYDTPYSFGGPANPYRQNVLKGDYPVIGQNTFFKFALTSDTVFEARDLPTPAGVSTARPNTAEFFGSGQQLFLTTYLGLSFELLHGNAAFKPPDWILKVTPVFNVNYLSVDENNVVNIDVREGTTRTDGHVGLQEAFFEKHLGDLSASYDFLTLTVGIQPFVSDFRGFLFVDSNLGARASFNLGNNRWQVNLAGFYMLEKDINSDLNTFDARDQIVVVANVYRQDFVFLGYTIQGSVHYNRDNASSHIDENGFPVRPPVLGDAQPHQLDIVYVGLAGSGHIDRVNLTHEYFFAYGEDSHNPIAGRPVDVAAHMFFLELSVDYDWYRPRFSFLFASGDDDPFDGRAKGFDSIIDIPNFAGGGSSYWIRQSLRLLGVGLNQRFSAYPDLRAAKFQGQANFVNPGIFLWNAGLDADLTQEVNASLNVSYLRFAETAVLEPFLNQNDIPEEIGFEVSLGARYRPLLTNNVELSGGLSAFFPGSGFEDIYEVDDTLYSAFLQVTLVY
jgi:hypothetical protein